MLVELKKKMINDYCLKWNVEYIDGLKLWNAKIIRRDENVIEYVWVDNENLMPR